MALEEVFIWKPGAATTRPAPPLSLTDTVPSFAVIALSSASPSLLRTATNAPPTAAPDESVTVTVIAACTSLGTAKSPKSPTAVIVPRAVLIRRVNIFPPRIFSIFISYDIYYYEYEGYT